MTTINDVVLIYLEDTPISFARVESILPDHKKDWYQIKLLMLQIPLQVVTWILKDAYISGEDFHMNEKKMRLEKVVCPVEAPDSMPGPVTREELPAKQESEEATEKKQGKVISFSDFKNKDNGSE